VENPILTTARTDRRISEERKRDIFFRITHLLLLYINLIRISSAFENFWTITENIPLSIVFYRFASLYVKFLCSRRILRRHPSYVMVKVFLGGFLYDR